MMQNLYFDFLSISEKAAIDSYKWIGKGDEKSADFAATSSMRKALNILNISAKVVIGEGERDQAPMLFIGEELGRGGPKIDIAVDPLEGTTICASGDRGALSVIVFGEENSLLHAPDLYMNKIAIGKNYPENFIDIDDDIKKTIDKLAKFKNCTTEDLNITILKRERHKELIEQVRKTKAKIKLINDGDISAVIEVALGKADLYVGIGGAPEGVIAASALKTLGGQMNSRLIFNNENQKSKAKLMNIDIDFKYNICNLVKANSIFYASGITNGDIIAGVKHKDGFTIVSSIVIDSFSNSVRYITSRYKY